MLLHLCYKITPFHAWLQEKYWNITGHSFMNKNKTRTLSPVKTSLSVLFSVLLSSTALADHDKSDEKSDHKTAHMITYKDLFNLEYAANPVVMPDGKNVVYERRSMDIMTDSLRRNLWTVSLDGKTHMPLLSDSKNHYNPVFSPDGNKLAYMSSKEGKVQIYLRDLKTGLTAKVTDVDKSPSGMRFSPDGKQLAFSMFTPAKGKSVFNVGFKPKGAKWADEAQYIDQTLFQRDGR